jgi:hypothetical protein
VRDPNSDRFRKWTELAATGEMIGPNRPVGRVTVGRNAIIGHLSTTRPGIWRNVLFEQARQVELLGVQRISINRSLDGDAATCTIVIVNDDMQAADYRPQGMDTGIGRPGYRTFNRGQQSPVPGVSVYEQYGPGNFPTDWRYPYVGDELGHEYLGNAVYEGGSGGYGGADARYNRGLLIPNRLVRTYQGYGSDNLDAVGEPAGRGEAGYVHPAYDTQLVQTGVWLVDTVEMGTDGLITLTCRDLAKLLLVQNIYPPMVPLERFPLQYGPPGTNAALGTTHVGEITDWSEAIKELCGWAGFTHWARPNYFPGVQADPVLGTDANGPTPMRVWGDFERIKAWPVEVTSHEDFHLKSFSEAINFIRATLGMLFYIDESGGCVFRFPNLVMGGNFIHDPQSNSRQVRIDEHPIEFHENANLLGYSVTLSDSAIRSEVVATGVEAATRGGGLIAGGIDLVGGDRSSALDYVNILAGQTRTLMLNRDTVSFKTWEEVQRYAELTALKILYTYRKAQASILAHPGLQLDDQVRVYERVTNEHNIHYVTGINSEMDLQSGSWTMDVTLHWMGADPDHPEILDYITLTDAVLALPGIQDRLGGVIPGASIRDREQQAQPQEGGT